ncbi:hypothetical protein ACKA06_04940 [Rossellomorea oryzaecorticis]|jgi:hypothetical protein|uniref:Lipoprotein n=1 Tax=Rossellomorea oryzaecorticis TaxID=1396505 RepID=A0ABW8VPD3_9BACI|nr:hypothetical protein KJK41_18765 [Bacillus haikouensis]
MKKILTVPIAFSIILAGCNNVASDKFAVKKQGENEGEMVNYINEETKISNTVSIADYHVPTDLTNLEERAEFIVNVRAIQDLGDDVVNGETLGSRKEVEVLKGYKNSLKKGDKIVIVEPAFVKDNEYYSVESYLKMDDGKDYTLFLQKGDDENEYGVVSLAYGKYSKNEKKFNGKLSSFSLLKEAEPYNFISDHTDEIELYEHIEDEVNNKYN